VSDLRIEIDNGIVQISLPLNHASEDTVRSRIQQVIPILQQLISSDVAVETRSYEEQIEKKSAVLALDLSCQAHLYKAQICAERIRSIAEGKESISQYGFPEFGSNGEKYDD